MSNIAKSVISDKKQSARMERSINIGKKTIQVSNFYNRAETNTNSIRAFACFLTGKQLLSLEKNFKPYNVRFNFSKKRNRGFSFEKDLERNEKFYRSVFRKRESI